jgi:hypothetical protein
MRPAAITRSFAALAGVCAVFAVAALGIATEARAVYHQIVNKETAWCLEANQAGDAYISPCQPGSAVQLWERWDGGWTRNVATGLCLKGSGAFSATSIHAAPCTWGEPRLNWLHWYGGWYQRAAFTAGGVANPAECLSRLPGSPQDVTAVPCVNPNGPNPPAELWFAVEATSLPPPPPPPPPPADSCEPSNSGSGLRLRVAFRRSKRVATASFHRRLRARGRLLGADGAPVAGATLCVAAQRRAGGPTRAVDSVVTDAQGRFAYRLGRGASRRVWFVHRAGGASVAASVVVRVRAPVALRASRRSLRNGQTVVLRGRVRGASRVRGLVVEVQAVVDRRWQTVATRRTGRGGAFRYAYRFKRTVGVRTYRLRARLPGQPGSPFATGASRPVRVTVVG